MHTKEYFNKSEVFIIGNDNSIDAMVYAIDNKIGNILKIGKAQTIQLAPGGMFDDPNNKIFVGENDEKSLDCIVKLKTITKKRFIKLVMAQGYQRNDAIKIHNDYMKKYNSRNRLCLMFFVASYNEPLEIKLMIGGIDVSITD